MKDRMFALALQIQSHFKTFYLGGGTALMFKYNHRQSIDLDFFNYKEFSFTRLASKLRKQFKVELEERFTDNIDFYIEEVKISFVFFPFESIKIENFKGLRIASDYDLFLNKVYAAGRRIDPKDPFDAAYLYRIHRWDKAQVQEDFANKFPDQSYKIYLGALLRFQDYGPLEPWITETLPTLL